MPVARRSYSRASDYLKKLDDPKIKLQTGNDIDLYPAFGDDFYQLAFWSVKDVSRSFPAVFAGWHREGPSTTIVNSGP